MSNVILHVPKGVHGALLVKIHTNPSKCIQYISENDCLVPPICEYYLQKPYHENSLCKHFKIQIPEQSFTVNASPPSQKYKIQIPHIVTDVERVRPHLKVRHGNLHNMTPALDSRQYHIDENYVTIFTTHFSRSIITAEGIKCCGQNANLLFFGSLKSHPCTQPPTMATVKVFISNKIKDYQDVRCTYDANHDLILKLQFFQKSCLFTFPTGFRERRKNV